MGLTLNKQRVVGLTLVGASAPVSLPLLLNLIFDVGVEHHAPLQQ